MALPCASLPSADLGGWWTISVLQTLTNQTNRKVFLLAQSRVMFRKKGGAWLGCGEKETLSTAGGVYPGRVGMESRTQSPKKLKYNYQVTPKCSWVCALEGKEVCVVKKPTVHVHCSTLL